jgi:hypothetical protein
VARSSDSAALIPPDGTPRSASQELTECGRVMAQGS